MKTMKFTFSSFGLTMLLLLLPSQPSWAFKIEPISRTFTPSGSNATQSYELISDKAELEAVEMSVVKRSMDLDGKESYEPADDDFLIYPPQIILKPNTRQTVRVTWLGDPIPQQEIAYRLVSKQVPINLKKPDIGKPNRPIGKVEVLLTYMGSLYIRPVDVQSKVVVDNVSVQKNANDKPTIALILENQGSARASLRNFSLNLTSGGKTVILKPNQIQEINSKVILAKNKRRFVFAYPADLPQGNVTATFDYTP
jgi:fimbrial chaperone protein